MARRVSEEHKRVAALQAARHLVARREPMYRLRPQDGRWTIDALLWITVTARSGREALDAARAAISEWLEVRRDAFDLEAAGAE